MTFYVISSITFFLLYYQWQAQNVTRSEIEADLTISLMGIKNRSKASFDAGTESQFETHIGMGSMALPQLSGLSLDLKIEIESTH